MTQDQEKPKPDFAAGIKGAELADGDMLVGMVGEDEVLLVRRGDEYYAVGAHCTHYHGPLVDGLVAGDTVRCPWHHACFSLRTGAALRAPALDPIDCWRVERRDGKVFVREKITRARTAQPTQRGAPKSIVIVGGGAAGLAAADMLRREGFEGRLSLLSADESPPCDRPNLSKDYLAGTAQEDWIPLRSPDYYRDQRIDLVLGAKVTLLDVKLKRVQLDDGKAYNYDALLLATGADPVRIPVPGATESKLHYLRTFADAKAIIAAVGNAKRALVIGSSFIGLEAAASLRTRGLEVHVVSPDKTPLERVMGPEVGSFIRTLHEAQGVVFHLGSTVTHVEGTRVTLSDGSTLEADMIVLGVGVRPSLALAEQAGLTLDRGVAVDEYLETSAPGVFAAGDIARWPDPNSGDRIRVEHWVVAERQGQVAAKNMLGQRVRYDAVPFFWSQHYDLSLNYVGHAENWDKIAIDGSLQARDATVTYSRAGRTLAVVTVWRDKQSLQAELAMEESHA
jgi:NADPH-dependent 2,4-dienoyl-CoA reductase/sulfur reductase-like enzyme/nitrite reductase/ring-hydroxylating ferredoxin subunit